MTARARWSWGHAGDYVLVYDLDGPLSVTNDAERVIETLAAQGVDVDSKRVIYRDSEGRWDGMHVDRGRFSGFRLLGCASPEQAIAKWNEREA
jgi:hypothetical protein